METNSTRRCSDTARIEAILERVLAAAGAPNRRISTAEMVKLSGARSPKGVGSRLRGLPDACLVSERIAVGDAVIVRGSGSARGWEAGPKAERTLAQCRAARRLNGDLPALDVTPARYDAVGAAERGWMTVRVLREQRGWFLYTGGVPALREAIDAMPEFAGEPNARGEMFVAELRLVAGDEVRTRVPRKFGFGGARTRGRHDLDWAPSIDAYCEEPIRACIVQGQWWERETRADDVAGVLETLDNYMIEWDEWRPAEGLPAQRHVIEIVTERDGRTWLPPPDLRIRKRLRATFSIGGETVQTEFEAIRGQENLALEQWILERGETERGWHGAEPLIVEFAADGAHPDPMESVTHRGHGPHQPVVQRNWAGEWSFRGPGRTVLQTAVDRHMENGNWTRATELLRELTTIEGWNLNAAEDLAVSTRAETTRIEREGIVRSIVDRGLAALEQAGFRWGRDKLDWYEIENRPFLRSHFQMAMIKERQGQGADALGIYRDIERTTRPNDPLGARYEVARLLTLAAEWLALSRHCARLGDDSRVDAVMTCWVAAEMTGKDEAGIDRMEEAIDLCPLAVSRVIRGGPSTPRDDHKGYAVGGFDEANRHWNRYRAFYETESGRALRTRLAGRFHAQREGDGAPHAWRRRSAEEVRNMAEYRRRLMALTSVDAQIRSEFWDLVSRVETGAEPFEIDHAQGRLGISRRRQDGANMRIEFLGGWSALVVETEVHGKVLRQGIAEFDQVENEIKAWWRSESRAG